jgi:hypothetical protein
VTVQVTVQLSSNFNLIPLDHHIAMLPNVLSNNSSNAVVIWGKLVIAPEPLLFCGLQH